MNIESKFPDMTAEQKKLHCAIMEIAGALDKTLRDLRPLLAAKFGLGEQKTNVALAVAVILNASFASKIAAGESFADCEDLDERLCELIAENSLD